MSTEPLFDAELYRRPAPGRTARRTAIHRALMQGLRLHPLTLVLCRPLKLHPLAEPARCPCEHGRVARDKCPLHRIIRSEPAATCGSCIWLGKLDPDREDGTNPSPLKCWKEPARVSRGGATTIRRWWPACVDFERYEGRPDDH